MKLALVSETYPPEINGVARTLETLARGLAERGHLVDVIRPRPAAAIPAPGGNPTQIVVPGLPLPGYPTLRLGTFCLRRLERRWRAAPPGIVHVATEGPLGLAALAAARRRGLPAVSSFHTDFVRYLPFCGLGLLAGPGREYLRRFHNATGATLVPTAQVARELEALGFDRLHVLGRGVDLELFDPRRRSPVLRREWGVDDDRTPVALYVGRLAPEKNVGLLERAGRHLRASRPQVRVVLVGDGPSARELRRRNSDFVFSGVRRAEDLAAHYASGDFFLFPSLTETFGNVVLEAMASGLAVVAFDCAAAHDLLADDIGVRVPPGDEAAFLAAAEALAGAAGELRMAGERARAAALAHGWGAVVGRYEAQLAPRAGE